MKYPIKILSLFDYNSFTGYATVSHNLVRQWKNTYGSNMLLDIVAVNYFGEDYREGENIRVISAKKKDILEDDWGRHVFGKTLHDNDYDLIFILNDKGVVRPMIPELEKIKQEKIKNKRPVFKSVFYFPVDHTLIGMEVKGFEFFDMLATYTKFGEQNILAINPKLITKLYVIPHGNNRDNFFPVMAEQREEFRKSYYGDNAGKFIVGCVNRNQSRKDIPNTIFGFLEYWDKLNRNSFLYLHMNPKDPMGWHLRTILAQTPLVEGRDFMFPPKEDYNKGADVSKLNMIYNSMDVFLSTATGGGWELTVTEAMATRTPVIIPKHTSFEELAGNNGERAFLLENQYPTVALVDNIIRWQSDMHEIAEKLFDVQCGQGVIRKVEAAYQFVNSDYLSWQRIAKVFTDNFKRLLK